MSEEYLMWLQVEKRFALYYSTSYGRRDSDNARDASIRLCVAVRVIIGPRKSRACLQNAGFLLQEWSGYFVITYMKNKLFPAIFVAIAFWAFSASAQMMPRGGLSVQQNSQMTEEEREGFQVWQKFQAGQVTCQSLSGDDYELLGDYFMGQWAGNSHEAMDQMMVRMMGEEGAEQMHIALGKRQSGCDLNAQLPVGGVGFMPMVGMMQNFGGGWPSFIASLICTILLWLLIIWGIIMLVRWLIMNSKNGTIKGKDSSAMRILKERYAKGEISRDEFEKMKKDLG